MSNIFKGIKVGDKVFSYYHQKWGKVVDRETNEFLVSFILDTGYGVTTKYDYDDGSGWLSDHMTQEVFTEEISPLPADDLSYLQEGDKVFIQPYQKWAEVTKVLLKERGIITKIPLHQVKDRQVTVTNTGMYSGTHKAPIAFLEEVPQPSEILTKLTGFYEFL